MIIFVDNKSLSGNKYSTYIILLYYTVIVIKNIIFINSTVEIGYNEFQGPAGFSSKVYIPIHIIERCNRFTD